MCLARFPIISVWSGLRMGTKTRCPRDGHSQDPRWAVGQLADAGCHTGAEDVGRSAEGTLLLLSECHFLQEAVRSRPSVSLGWEEPSGAVQCHAHLAARATLPGPPGGHLPLGWPRTYRRPCKDVVHELHARTLTRGSGTQDALGGSGRK